MDPYLTITLLTRSPHYSHLFLVGWKRLVSHLLSNPLVRPQFYGLKMVILTRFHCTYKLMITKKSTVYFSRSMTGSIQHLFKIVQTMKQHWKHQQFSAPLSKARMIFPITAITKRSRTLQNHHLHRTLEVVYHSLLTDIFLRYLP